MTTAIPLNIKTTLYNKCKEFVLQNTLNAQTAIDLAVEAVTGDSKSSAGDKHETGRAMAHLEQEKGARQLSESLRLKQVLEKIIPENQSKKVSAGSLVITNKGRFYIAVGAGKIIIDNEVYFAVSAVSPIAKALLGSRENDEIDFNGVAYLILEVL